MFISFCRVNIQDLSKCRLLQDCFMGERVKNKVYLEWGFRTWKSYLSYIQITIDDQSIAWIKVEHPTINRIVVIGDATFFSRKQTIEIHHYCAIMSKILFVKNVWLLLHSFVHIPSVEIWRDFKLKICWLQISRSK